MKKLLALLLVLLSSAFASAQEKPFRPTGRKPVPPEVKAKMHADAFARHGHRQGLMVKASTPPAKFDCVDMGWVPVVRDQADCGSCYLVSTADQVTCVFIKAGYGKADDSFKISDQFGMDCHDFGGCNGGNGTEVIGWMLKNGFPAERYIDVAGVTHNDYPAYQARSGTCRTKAGAKLWKPKDWGFAAGDQSNRPATVAEIKAAMMAYGVLNISFDADGTYSNAGKTPIKITGRSINHETTMVGWDDAKKAWKTRGNWSKDFADGGYVWMTYDSYIVDVFWVSAVALPPPPTPPDPTPVPPTPIPPGPGPGPSPPTPGASNIIVLEPPGADGKGNYYFAAPGSIVLTPESQKSILEIFKLSPRSGIPSVPSAAPKLGTPKVMRETDEPPVLARPTLIELMSAVVAKTDKERAAMLNKLYPPIKEQP